MSAPEQPKLGFDSPQEEAESSHLSLVPEAPPASESPEVAAAGLKLAREALAANKPQDPEAEAQRASAVSHFEKLAVGRLDKYLSTPDPRPFYSPHERDIMIHNPRAYFESVRKDVSPSPGGEEDLSVRRHRAEAKARKGRTKAYGERLIESLTLVDNCRSWRWYLLNGDLQPIHPGDSPELIHQRVALDLADLLTEARLRGLLAGGHSSRVIASLKARFDSVVGPASAEGEPDEEVGLAIRLTVLVGKNAVLKTNDWQGRFWGISKGYRFLDPDLPEIFEQFNDLRPRTCREHFDPLSDLLVDLKAKQSAKA